MTDPSHGPFSTTVERRRNDQLIVWAAGEFDMNAELGFMEAVTSAVASKPQSMVVDLSKVGFLDSTGVRCLIVGKRRAEAAGVSFTIRGAQGITETVLSMTGVLPAMAKPADDADDAEAEPRKAWWKRLRPRS
ncbi:STAS domain-containing protein [Catelliglobosispora koreensis]|uniref:STAS domain-containing protein n=1 Tax=Catelliglobosispora koreensis TaxID=129052 RepID=UPI0003696A97|nr:STAS domain-containing protein [Catelliglobosispora koreensis]